MAKFDFKKSFKSRKFKYGGFATLITSVVLAVVILLNLVASLKPVNTWELDLTKNKLFTLSDESKNILKEVNQKVTIIGLYQEGKSDSRNDYMKKILSKYEAASSNIDIQYVDPELHPGYLSDYKEGNNIKNNSIIVKSGDKYKIIDSSELFPEDVDPYTGQSSGVSSLNAEPSITAAIMYVTSQKKPTLYSLQGHKELKFDTQTNTYLENENYSVSELELLKGNWNPVPGDILLIAFPKIDISKDEYTKIESFVANGGKILAVMGFTGVDLPNFRKVFNLYGVDLKNAFVIEGDKNKMYQSVVNIGPDLTNHAIVEPIKNDSLPIILEGCMPILQLQSKKDTTTIESLLQTSSSAYARSDAKIQTAEKQSSDIPGPFDVGVAVTNTVDSTNPDKNSKLVLVSSDSLLTQQIGGNIDMFMNSLSWLAERKENLVVRPKDISAQPLTITQGQSYTLLVFSIFVIPGIIAAVGLGVWLRRRHL